MSRLQKTAIVIAILMVGLLAIPFSAYAQNVKEEESEMGRVLRELARILPEEAEEWIGYDRIREMEKGDGADLSVIASLGGWKSLPDLLKMAVKGLLSPFLRVTIGCVGMVLFSAVSTMLVTEHRPMASAMQLLIATVLSLHLLQIGKEVLTILKNALLSVSVWIKALIPTVAAVYAAGGNFTAAAAEESILLLLVESIEVICGSVLQPLVMTCFLIGVFTGALSDGRLKGLCASTSRAVIWILTLMMLVFSTVLASQHTIAAGADSLLLKGVKFAASGLIPIVGGSVAEIMNTTAGAVGFMRSTVGTMATVSVLALLLGPLLRIGGMRLAMRLSALLAQCFGCGREQGLFDEIGSVFDMALAILVVCFLAALFAMTLMLRCTVAAAAAT